MYTFSTAVSKFGETLGPFCMDLQSEAKFVQYNVRGKLCVLILGQEHPQLLSMPQAPPAANEPYYNTIS
jgi:hypothetical protein